MTWKLQKKRKEKRHSSSFNNLYVSPFHNLVHFLSFTLFIHIYSPPLNVPDGTSLKHDKMLRFLYLTCQNVSPHPHPHQLKSQKLAASRGLLTGFPGKSPAVPGTDQLPPCSVSPCWLPSCHFCLKAHHPCDITALQGHQSVANISSN